MAVGTLNLNFVELQNKLFHESKRNKQKGRHGYNTILVLSSSVNSNFFNSVSVFAACSSELNFEAAVSSGQVSGQAWCAGDSDEFQWITLDFGGEKIISGKLSIFPSTNIY